MRWPSHHRWYIVTLVLSIEVQKEKIAKLQTKQTIAESRQGLPTSGQQLELGRGTGAIRHSHRCLGPGPQAPRATASTPTARAPPPRSRTTPPMRPRHGPFQRSCASRGASRDRIVRATAERGRHTTLANSFLLGPLPGP